MRKQTRTHNEEIQDLRNQFGVSRQEWSEKHSKLEKRLIYQCKESKEKEQQIKQLTDSIRDGERRLSEIRTKSSQYEETIKRREEMFESEKLQSWRLATKLKENEEEVLDLRKKVAELNELNKEREKMTEMQETVYNKGMHYGYAQGLLQVGEETEKMQATITEKDREKSELATKLKQLEHELAKEIKVTEAYNKQLLEKDNEIEKMKANNRSTGSQYIVGELQQHLAINESKFDQERLEFQGQIKVLQQELQNNQQMYQELSNENSRNVDRLAAEMNAKVSSDETALENISIQARPMKIAEDYNQLLSNDWLDAKSALDERNPEDGMESNKVMLLFNVLMVCEAEAISLYRQLVQQLGKTLRDPVHNLIPIDAHHTSQDVIREPKTAEEAAQDLPQNLMTVIGDYFRNYSNTANLDILHQRVLCAMLSQYSEQADIIHDRLHIEGLNDFVTASMRPPMTFDASQIGKAWSKDGFLDLMWGSDPSSQDAVIQYYKGPRLLHAGKAMVKGVVFVHTCKNPQK